jgi:hypothetical protein
VGGGDGPLADGFGVVGRHAEPVAGEGLAQRRPAGAELGGGGVDAAELFGELEGAFGLGAVGQEAAGLPAQLVYRLGCPLGLQGSLQVFRWLGRWGPDGMAEPSRSGGGDDYS